MGGLLDMKAYGRAKSIQGAVGFMRKKQEQEQMREAERRKVKLLFFDVETTGLLYFKHAIHQLSGKVVVDGKIECWFDYKMKPWTGAEINPIALQIGRVTEAQIMAYPDPVVAYNCFVEMLSKFVDKYDDLDKFYLVGYNNAAFDNNFLRKLFAMNDDKYFGSWFWNNTIDVMTMATVKLIDKRTEMPNFELKTVAKQMGIEVDENKLHEAGYDVELTKAVYDRLMES